VTGKPGERALRWVPLDEAKRRGLEAFKVAYYRRALPIEAVAEAALLAALGEDT